MDHDQESANGGNHLFLKCLTVLFWVQIADAAIELLANIPGVDTLGNWVGYALEAVLLGVLFQMSAVNKRYRKASILGAVSLVCLLVNTLVITNLRVMNMVGSVITLAASVCAILGEYHEYYAHAEIIEPLDRKLAGKWRSLFVWQIVLGLLGSFASVVTVVVIVLAGGAENAAEVVLILLKALSLILYAVYLVMLGRMRRLMEKQEADI